MAEHANTESEHDAERNKQLKRAHPVAFNSSNIPDFNKKFKSAKGIKIYCTYLAINVIFELFLLIASADKIEEQKINNVKNISSKVSAKESSDSEEEERPQSIERDITQNSIVMDDSIASNDDNDRRNEVNSSLETVEKEDESRGRARFLESMSK